MYFLIFLRSLIIPQYMVKYRSMNVIIGVAIFIIFSFLMGIPVGHLVAKDKVEISNEYNYQVLKDIPNTEAINLVITELVSKECKVKDEKELTCNNLTFLGDELVEYENTIVYTKDNVKKYLHFVIELFDVQDFYLEEMKLDYNPIEDFTLTNYPYHENEEHYLIILFSDSLYFQAHPFGTDEASIVHNNRQLKTSYIQIDYQNTLSEFDFSISNPETNGYQVGNYLLNQITLGKMNTTKLHAFTLTFIFGTAFTWITILLVWIFFRNNGKFKDFKEYYNIASMNNIPISILFFILLWFFPNLIYFYIFVFSITYTITIYSINTRDDFV